MIRREFKPERLNALLNDRSVLPWVTVPGHASLDAGPLLADRRNVVLMTQDGAAALVFHFRARGLYEVHAQALPQARGRTSLAMALASFAWMFRNTDCRKIVAAIPADNLAAEALAVRVGMRFAETLASAWPREGRMVDVRKYALTKGMWKVQKCLPPQQS